MKFLLLQIIILLTFTSISLTSAEAIDFSCPTNIPVNEEFTCTIEITQGEGIYDVKLNVVDPSSSSVIRILHGETWKSGFYYLKEFIGINEPKEIRVKGEVEGTYESVVKIRKGSFQESFPFTLSFGEEEISGNEGQEENSSENEQETNESNEQTEEETPEEETTEEVKINEQTEEQEVQEIIPKTISLNNKVQIFEEEIPAQEIIYESKNSKILGSAPYALSIFLVIIIAFLLWERF